MLTYNGLLYKKRMELGLSLREMAKSIGIKHFHYYLLENGYIKPNANDKKKISAYFDLNYDEYLVNEPSYPAELPEKKKKKIVVWFYDFIGSLGFKIAALILVLLSAAFMISGFVIGDNVANHANNYFNEDYCGFVSRLKENGSNILSITSKEVVKQYYTTEKDEFGNVKYISITSSSDPNEVDSLSLTATYRTDKYRLIYDLTPSTLNSEKLYLISAKLSYFNEAITISGDIIATPDRTVYVSTLRKMDEKGNKSHIGLTDMERELYKQDLSSHVKEGDNFEKDFNDLIIKSDIFAEKSKTLSINQLCIYNNEGNKKIFTPYLYSMIAKYLGIVLTGATLFTLIFAFIYGSKKGKPVEYRPKKIEVELSLTNPIKTDTRFFPFIPETFLEVIGIIMVFIGSFRIVMYVNAFANGTLSSVLGSYTASQFLQVFLVGMFLLYFIDFDIFLDDKRVFRNIFLYGIMYICLYSLENLLMRAFENGGIVGTSITTFVKFPNMFGSIACYYLIMFFLFFTPKRIKKHSTIVLYRCCSILPVIFIITSWILYNGNGVIFNATFPIEVRNLFNGEKFPFSILAITYLFSLYFLRLFFEKKYGKERAEIFFNGNKFIWIKNIMVSIIIAIIAIVEFAFSSSPYAHKLGIGLSWDIVLLIPLLLLYHPHKGPRNLFIDYTTLGLYMISISFAYIIVAGVAIEYII